MIDVSNAPRVPSGNPADPFPIVNAGLDVLKHQEVYAEDPTNLDPLVYSYLQGRWGGIAIAADDEALTDDATNYIVVDRVTGALSVSTSNTNWNNQSAYARVARIVTASGARTDVEDYRAGPGGVHGQAGSVGAGTIGKQAIYIAAAAITPSTSGGCAALATVATSANQPDLQTLDFDTTTQEFAQFSIVMPKKWNEGTVTFKAHWSHPATTVNFGVAWQLQGVAVGDDDAIAAAYGTEQVVTDTGGTTNDLYSSAESAAITIAGAPAAEDMVFFRVARVPSNGADTLAVDARLHGITLYVTTDAETDA